MGKQANLWKKYSIKDGKIVKNVTFCPRCGEGYIMAEHEDRYYCGNCHNVLWKSGKK